MLPGMGGRNPNPKKLAAMMRSMGIEMEDIDDVEEVVIRCKDRDIVLAGASVQKVTAQGSVTWQVMGEPTERPRAPAEPVKLEVREEDVALVAEQAKVSKEEARRALEAAGGEPAEAILKLMGDA